MLAGEETAGSSESRLDLVDDEDGPVLAAQLLRLRKEASIGLIEPLPLNRLDD